MNPSGDPTLQTCLKVLAGTVIEQIERCSENAPKALIQWILTSQENGNTAKNQDKFFI